jgi:hypothetical protein
VGIPGHERGSGRKWSGLLFIYIERRLNMVVLGRTLLVIHFIFLLLAAIFLGSSFAGFTGGATMITSACLVLVSWAGFAGFTIKYGVRLANSVAREETGNLTQALMWANGLFITVTALSAGTGVLLAFLAFVGCGPSWLPSLYHWTGMIGTVLGFLAFFLLPVIVRACVGETDKYSTLHRWGWVVFMPLGTALVWGAIWLGAYLKFKDDVNVKEYTRTGYKLPFPGGDTSWVIQGNNTSADHNAAVLGQKFAWDFRRPCGSPLLASRSGKVIYAIHSNDGFGSNSPNNQIQVLHPDGTVAVYLHLQQGSIPGNLFPTGVSTPAVTQGQQIANVGCVGNSATGHIHFEVRQNQAGNYTSVPTVGVVFADVTDDNGIPRTFGAYTSGNSKVR